MPRHFERVVYDECDPDCMRSSKVRWEMDNVLKCFKEVDEQKLKAATQVSIKKFFFFLIPNESASVSSAEPSNSIGQPARQHRICVHLRQKLSDAQGTVSRGVVMVEHTGVVLPLVPD